MTRDELIARLKGYEWTDFECKKAQRDVPKDAYTTVSAFANTEGGWLLLGVSESAGRLEVTGIDPAAFDRVQDAFLTTLRSGQKLNQLVDAQPGDQHGLCADHVGDGHHRQIEAIGTAGVGVGAGRW